MIARILFVIVAVLFAGLPVPSALVAPAQAIPPGPHIGGHAGYVEAADADDGNYQFGGHLEIPLIPWLAVHGSVDYRLVDTFTTTFGSTSGELELKSVPVTATARLYLPTISTMSLFAGAGAGWYYLVYDYSDQLESVGFEDDETNEFGWHVSAGALFRVAPKLSVYGEGRLIYIDPEHEINQDLIDDVEDFDYDSFYIAAGVNLHF